MMQLDLFDTVFKELATLIDVDQFNVSWSYSKMQAFRDCPRKFYFLYYGSKKRSAKDEILKPKLIELSKLSNRYMVQGSVIHQLVKLYFTRAKKGEVWDFSRLTSFGLKIISDIINHNESTKKGSAITPAYPQPLIKELQNGELPIDQFEEEITELLKNSLTNFFQSEEYAHLRFGGTRPSSKIEANTSFSLNGSTEVDGKVDIAFLDQKRLIIADWKTGKKDFEDTSLQLLVYALWARQLEEWEFDEIQIQKAYLATGKLEKLEFSELHVDRARVKIMQDAELLHEMDEFGKNAFKEAFAMRVGKNCKLCPFEEICFSK